MILNNISKFQIILASKSPRRQELLKQIGITFTTQTKEIEEVFPPALFKEEIPLYLSKLKANAFEVKNNELIITSDTIVWVENEQFGKPKDNEDAIRMLKALSNKTHQVITAVTLKTKEKETSFFEETHVSFKELTDSEINYYIENYNPYDKAGAYGIQDWIGNIGIIQIQGDYYNVMGLPTARLYKELSNF